MNQIRVVKIFLIVMVVLYIIGTSYGGLMRSDACFKLTESSFQGLKDDGIPETIVDNLKSLQNEKFYSEDEFCEAAKNIIEEMIVDNLKSLQNENYSEDEFCEAVKNIIEEGQLTQYKELILKHATHAECKTNDTVQNLERLLPKCFIQYLEQYLEKELPEVGN